jgi:hypothetical protein
VLAFLHRRRRAVLVTAAAAVCVAILCSLLLPDVPGLGIGLLVAVAVFAVPCAAEKVRLRPGGAVLAGLAYFALIGACFVLGLHEPARAAWLTLLIAIAAPLPVVWPALWRGATTLPKPAGPRAQRLTGTLLMAASAGVYFYTDDQLSHHGLIDTLPSAMMLPGFYGLMLILSTLPDPPPPGPPAAPPPPPRPPWARDVTDGSAPEG